MKKIVRIFLVIMILIFISIYYMVLCDIKYHNKLEKKIINNTELRIINYINAYKDYYIVKDNEYLYLIDNNYKIKMKKELYLMHQNDNNYDIIYINDDFMYLKDYIKNNIIVYEYYDLYTYELVDRITFGGDNNG